VSVEIAEHGSGTGLAALKPGNADIAHSYRPIKHQEAKDKADQADQKSPPTQQTNPNQADPEKLQPPNTLTQLQTLQ
ncbi:hypothetical protein RA273_29790, partial [Pseudomonas syringae pv. tagetis]